MEHNTRETWHRAVAAASISLLLAIPAFASAALFNGNDRNEPLGTRIFNRVIERLCQVQEARGNRVILVDPSRCVPPLPPSSTLTLMKTIINDNGGTATTTDFQARIDGSDVPWGVAQTVSIGAHTASETTLSGYLASSWGGDCAADGIITLVAGGNKTCAITNNDQQGSLIVDKVTEPSGSTRVFDIVATGTGAIVGGGSGTTTDAVDKEYMVAAGTYSVTETVPDGWVRTGNTCADVTIGVGETKTCTITNVKLPKLTVTKVVMNDNGGTATTTDFTLFIDNATTTSGTATTTTIGAHVVTESATSSYTATFGGNCAANGTITLAAGDVKICTITNNDNPESGGGAGGGGGSTGKLLITEVLYDLGVGQGAEPANEWVEIYNGTSAALNLSGFTLNDNATTSLDVIPNGTIVPSNTYLIVFGSTTTASFWTIPSGAMTVVLATNIGGSGGLANAGDRVVLMSPLGIGVDAVSWGSDTSAFSPSVPSVPSNSGSSITRTSATTDTDAAADWTADATPTPGSTGP